jgi:hypothetical protein
MGKTNVCVLMSPIQDAIITSFGQRSKTHHFVLFFLPLVSKWFPLNLTFLTVCLFETHVFGVWFSS